MTLVPDALALVSDLIPNTASQLFLDPADEAPCDPTTGDLHFSGVLPPPNGTFYGDGAGDAPAHPRHTLEVALESEGKRIGAITLFRADGPGFEPEDREDLERVAAYFAHAYRTAPEPAAGLSGVVEDEAMLLTTASGEILFLSDSAGALLDQLAFQECAVFDRKLLPPFGMRLLEAVVHGDRFPWRLPSHTLALAGGALEARAQWMRGGGALALGPSDLAHGRVVGIFLKYVVPMPLRVWRALAGVELSPQQTEVAFWMGVGGGRDAARAHMDVSDAVLRDCVKAIYEKFGCTSEAGLLALLRPAASRT